MLAVAPDADAAARAELALPLASLGIQLIGSGPGLINVNKLPPLLDIARTHPSPLPLDTVVLSACSTHVVGDRYDEAFSLATAFLAAGARTVIGSLWNIPDGPTSWLAFLFHRHRSAGAPPADALRAAQLWMLDPDSDVPDALPALLHTANVGDIPLHHPLLWAGLTHLGR